MKTTVSLFLLSAEVDALAVKLAADKPTYKDYVERKKKEGEKPLSKGEWDLKVWTDKRKEREEKAKTYVPNPKHDDAYKGHLKLIESKPGMKPMSRMDFDEWSEKKEKDSKNWPKRPPKEDPEPIPSSGALHKDGKLTPEGEKAAKSLKAVHDALKGTGISHDLESDPKKYKSMSELHNAVKDSLQDVADKIRAKFDAYEDEKGRPPPASDKSFKKMDEALFKLDHLSKKHFGKGLEKSKGRKYEFFKD